MKDFAPPNDKIEMEVIREGFKEAWNNAQKDRFKKWGAWVFDRWIFTTALVLVFGWLAFVAWSYDFELNYYKCENPGGSEVRYIGSDITDARLNFGCKNPFYKPTSWRNSEYLMPGEYGTKLGPLFQSVNYVPVVLLLLAFYINYKVYNKGVTK